MSYIQVGIRIASFCLPEESSRLPMPWCFNRRMLWHPSLDFKIHVSGHLQDRVTGISHSRWPRLNPSTSFTSVLQALPSLMSGNTNSLVTQARDTGAGADVTLLFSSTQLLTHRSFPSYLPNASLTYAMPHPCFFSPFIVWFWVSFFSFLKFLHLGPFAMKDFFNPYSDCALKFLFFL